MGVSFSRLANVSLKERAVRELENKILSGELKPGDRLPPERDLAQAMGVSRSLINLCILELESKGFVRIVARQGTFVNDYKKQGTPQILLSLMNYDSQNMDRALFESMMDTRRLIEYECARLAIKNASEDDLRLIEEALGVMERSNSPDSFVEGNFSFHHALTSASDNILYAMIFNSFGRVIRFLIKLYFTSEERRQSSITQHRELIGALFARDEDAAFGALKRTLDTGITALSGVISG